MKDIICLKLVTGEELIATQKGNDVYEDVAVVAMMNGREAGKVSMAVMPFLAYSDESAFTIKPESIIIKHKPNQDLVNYYNSIFGAGIQIVSSI